MNDLTRKHIEALANWACTAARELMDSLPIGEVRGGYRRASATDREGFTTDELVDVASGVPICIVYRRANGVTVAGFCQPWPPVLRRFVEAVLFEDVLGASGDSPETGDRAVAATRT
jgi:hypothetical protein